MLRLIEPTRESWVGEAMGRMDLVLLDHAHCEKKAASTALNLIFRYQYRSELMVPLSSLAREELRHFEMVVKLLEKRDLKFQKLKPSTYGGELYKVIRMDEPNRFVDTMICCAFIEARSCERMKLLSESLEDVELAQMYAGLLASEARHHQAYLDLAAMQIPEEEVYARVAEIGAHEAAVIAKPGDEIRLHS
jgi:tRNA-(ms[2]io[6]A)-hydroxylase